MGPRESRFFKLIDPLRDVLTSDDARRILKMPKDTGADLVGAHRYAPFIDFVRQSGLLPGDEIDALLRSHNSGYLLPPDGNRN